MRSFKKLSALLLAAVFTLLLPSGAFAAGTPDYAAATPVESVSSSTAFTRDFSCSITGNGCA